MDNSGIRQAKPKDLMQVTALVTAAYGPWVAVIGAVPGPMQDDYAAAIRAGQVSVLETGSTIDALVVLIPQTDALPLDNVAVGPWAQGRGHGQRLMRFVEDLARAEGFTRIRLYAHQKMARNIAMYQRAGYVETARVTERGLDRVYMEKALG